MAVVSLSNESTLIRTDSNRLERIQAISRRYACLRVPERLPERRVRTFRPERIGI